jgi:hypothetical protein
MKAINVLRCVRTSLSLSSSLPCQLLIIKHISISKQKERRKHHQLKYNNSNNNNRNDTTTTPDFQALLRQLYKKSHPDLLRSSYPNESTVNDNSMQLLNGVLSAIKSTTEMPPAMRKSIPFYLKSSNSTELKSVLLNINTSGGYSKNQITTTFENFFIEAGITTKDNGKFKWNDDYFPPITSQTNTSE